MGHSFPGLAGPEEASYGREGAASTSLQVVGRLVVKEGAQVIHERGDAVQGIPSIGDASHGKGRNSRPNLAPKVCVTL